MSHTAVHNYMSRGGAWCTKFNDGAENTCRLILMAASTAQVAVKIHEIQEKSHEGIKNVKTAFEASLGIISALRCLITLEKLVTGKLIWKSEKNDAVIGGVAVRSGHFIRAKIDEDGEYARINTGPFEDDYVRDPKNGQLVPRDLIDVIQDIFLAVGRFFSAVFHFHRLGLYDLGKHAKWMSHATMAAFAGVVTIGLIKALKDTIEAPVDKIRQAAVEVFSSLLDIASFPNEAGLLGADVHPAISIIGSALSAVSAGVYLLKEWVYHNS